MTAIGRPLQAQAVATKEEVGEQLGDWQEKEVSWGEKVGLSSLLGAYGKELEGNVAARSETALKNTGEPEKKKRTKKTPPPGPQKEKQKITKSRAR